MKLRDTQMLLEDAVRMQAPRAVWGGVARVRWGIFRLAWKAYWGLSNRER